MADPQPPAPQDDPPRRPVGTGVIVFVYILVVLFLLAAIVAFAGAIKNVGTSPRPALIGEGIAMLVCAALMIGGLRVLHRRRRGD